MNRPFLSLALPLLFGATLSAQAPQVPTAPAALPRRVPLHGSPHDPSYGLWAAGATYKASFHDGFVFYPVLGDGHPENLPVRWTTTSVRAGETELSTRSEASPRISGDWRCEYDLGGVVETYELRADGVEQSFLVRERPSSSGDLVIEGRFDSKLRAQRASSGSNELHFVDASGRSIVSYGEATAIDARGAAFPVATELDGACVRLRLAADALAEASFPLVVDPLVARLGITMIDPVVSTDVGCDDVTSGPNTMLAMELAVSASDHDLYYALGTSNFSSFAWAAHYLNVTDQRDPSVAFVRGADRWIVLFTEYTDDVMAYVHPRASFVRDAGGAPFQVTSSGVQPDVGGTRNSFVDEALVVFRSNAPGSQWVVGRTVDVATKALGNFFDIPSTSSILIARHHPCVNQASSSNGWVVAWEETDYLSLSYVRANQAFANETIGTDAVLSFLSSGPPLDAKRPQVAGAANRYLLSYVYGGASSSDSGSEIHSVRFDWSSSQQPPSVRSQRVTATAGSLSSLGEVALGFDYGTQSHWCLFHRRTSLVGGNGSLYRLGYTGGVVASASIAPGNGATTLGATAASFDGTLDRFVFTYGTNGASAPAFLHWLQYDGSHASYGTSCGGEIGVPREPNAGAELFRVTLSQAIGGTAAWLMVGVDSASVPLDVWGLLGCSLLVDPAVLVVLPASVVSGAAALTFALPDAPPLFGDVDCQWLVMIPGANPANLTTSGGVELHIR